LSCGVGRQGCSARPIVEAEKQKGAAAHLPEQEWCDAFVVFRRPPLACLERI
jgi:hypothetical protein